jgi:peptide/nickel transport system ATP-binding protein/oligopeptide transport system ATP-binding protein
MNDNKENTILEVKNLQVRFFTDEGVLPAIDNLSFSISRGETLGIVGESGCGKSMTALSIMKLISNPGKITDGKILYKGNDLIKLNDKEIRKIRGNNISMIFQEPMTSLNPVLTIGNQIIEAIITHNSNINKKEAREKAIEMLKLVKIPLPEKRIDEYPHELSGGMRQRVMIAMALSCKPELLICDEPTTALDVTIQAQILKLINQLKNEFNSSVIMITHDMGVIAKTADCIAVMYLGRMVEMGSAKEIFKNPLHPYTNRLLKSIPKLGRKTGQRLDAIKGNVPMPLDLPEECGFYSRCLEAKEGLCNRCIPPCWLPGCQLQRKYNFQNHFLWFLISYYDEKRMHSFLFALPERKQLRCTSV